MALRPDQDNRVPAAVGAAALAGVAVVGKAVHDRRARRDEARRRRYRLRGGEPAGEGLRRIARGRLDDALERLERPVDDDTGDAIHDVRKDLKRLRALLRLARDELTRDVRRNENTVLRAAGRHLSGPRDAEVLVETLDDMAGRHADEIGPQRFAALRAELATELDDAQAQLARDPHALRDVATALTATRERVAAWPLTDDAPPAALADGFERLVRRGRRAFDEARRDPTTETFHELRKRTKDVWHAAQILRPVAPKRMRRLGRCAHDLADVLGDDHDLAVLAEAARAHPERLAPGELAELEALVERRREKLRRRALKLADRLYARAPRRVAAAVR